MRIVHLLAPAPFGGLEQVVRHLACAQAGHHDVIVVAVSSAAKEVLPLLDQVRRAGVVTETVSVGPRSYLAERREVRRILEHYSPDLVHTHGSKPDILYGSVARRLGLPLVTTVHGFTGGSWKNRFVERLQLKSYRQFDGVIAVSHSLVPSLIRCGVPRAKVRVIPNALPPLALMERADARRALGLDEGGFHIGWIGRLSHEKGPDIMLSALAEVTDLPVSVSFIGDGHLGKALHAEGRLLGSVAVRWHGIVCEAERLFRAFDLIVLSSRTEGTPMVLLEAMASRVPVIATVVGGIPEVVGPSEALLIPPEDPTSLASAIRDTYERPGEARERADAAHRRFQEAFSLLPWLEAHDRLYSSLV